MKTDNNNNLSSRDLTFEWGLDAPNRLAEEADKLDNKGLSILLVASAILAISAALIDKITISWYLTPLAISFLAYLLVTWQSIRVFSLRKVIVTPNPKVLREKYWSLPEEETKEKYWKTTEESTDYNLDVVNQKGQGLRIAIPALAVEVIFLVIWLFVRFLR